MKDSKKVEKFIEKLEKVYRDHHDEDGGGDMEDLFYNEKESLLNACDFQIPLDGSLADLDEITALMDEAHDAGKAGKELYSYQPEGESVYVWTASSEDDVIKKLEKKLSSLSKKLLK